MSEVCPECGTPMPAGGTCRDHFDALLLLEWQIPEGAGALAHFYAVASYGLQHPNSMNYTEEALTGLHHAVGDMLCSTITLEELKSRTRQAVNGSVRVTRHGNKRELSVEPIVWPMTVADILTVEVDAAAYLARVTEWARSVWETLQRSMNKG